MDEKWGVYKRFMLPVVLGVIGLVFLGYGLMGYLGGREEKEEILFESGEDSASLVKISVSPISQKMILVDAAGSVVRPGVYEVEEGSRVRDVLGAAGGMSGEADREWVSKGLNLAAKVVDGGKIYIPKIGERFKSPQPLFDKGGSMGVGEELIDINSAGLKELESLPGVGVVTAGKIVEGRPYAAVEELVERKVVGAKVFEKIREKVRVY